MTTRLLTPRTRFALPDKSLAIKLTIPDGDLTLGIEPATRLYAIGMLGAPRQTEHAQVPSGRTLANVMGFSFSPLFSLPLGPQTLSLEGTGMARIDQAPVPLGTLTFHRTKLRGYSPLTPVQ